MRKNLLMAAMMLMASAATFAQSKVYSLIERINRQHGTYITDYAEQIGLGSKKYVLIDLDK